MFEFLVGVLSYFFFQPAFHNWYNKGHGCNILSDMVYFLKDPLLLIEKKSSGFLLSLTEWSFIVCPTQYNCTFYFCNSSIKLTTKYFHWDFY